MAMINIEKVKRKGLRVDLEKFAREGHKSIPGDNHCRLKMNRICASTLPMEGLRVME